MFSFLHAADIHLDSPLQKLERYEGAPVQEMRHATRRALERLVDLAITERVDFVLFTGDLYDGDWKDYNTGLFFVSQVKKLREAGILSYIITGNHDAANKMTKSLRLPEGAHLFPTDQPSTIIVESLGIAIHGQGFASQAVKKDLSAHYPPALRGFFNIGMLHTCATGREDHEPYAPCTIEGLRSKGYDYWALGHVHSREVVCEAPIIVFPGNIQGRHIRESGPRGCMLVSVDSSGQAGLDFQPLDVVRWESCAFDISMVDSGNDVVDGVIEMLTEVLERNEGLPVIVRVEVHGKGPAHEDLASDPERWANEIRSAAIDSAYGRAWVEKVVFKTSPAENPPPPEDGPVWEILNVIKEAQKDPARLTELNAMLKPFWRSLPRELRESCGVLQQEDSFILSTLEHVSPVLLRRLMRGRRNS